jgi:hypothetical protein
MKTKLTELPGTRDHTRVLTLCCTFFHKGFGLPKVLIVSDLTLIFRYLELHFRVIYFIIIYNPSAFKLDVPAEKCFFLLAIHFYILRVLHSTNKWLKYFGEIEFKVYFHIFWNLFSNSEKLPGPLLRTLAQVEKSAAVQNFHTLANSLGILLLYDAEILPAHYTWKVAFTNLIHKQSIQVKM